MSRPGIAPVAKVFLDANIIIAFVKSSSISALAGLKKHRVVVTHHVFSEILPGRGREELETLISNGHAELYKLEEPEELSVFSMCHEDLGLGLGESSCIAAAKSSNGLFLCEDKTARKKARKILQPKRVGELVDLLIWMVREGVWTPTEADSVIQKLKKVDSYRPPFKGSISQFI